MAQTTAGFTGADLENLMNEAAINAARENKKFINQSDINKAFVKVGIGAEKKSKVISEKEKKITAYHEAGHAILFHLLPDEGPVHTISIIPTGIGAAGYTMPLPENDRDVQLRSVDASGYHGRSLGGRIAEEIIFGDVTTGASQDIKQATSIARAMVTQYGMSEKLGMINYGGDEDEVFIGRDLAHTRSYGERVCGRDRRRGKAHRGRVLREGEGRSFWSMRMCLHSAAAPVSSRRRRSARRSLTKFIYRWR
ncbi:MAG: hypothetical protein ACLU48_05480 [Clostridiaceae bacterium]